MPFVSKFPSNGFKERMGLLTKDAEAGCHEGSKVTALLLAGLEIVTLLLRLLGSKNFLRVLGVVGLGIKIDNSDINDAVGGRRVSSTKEEITTILGAQSNSRGRLGNSGNRVSQRGWRCWRALLGKDHGLTADTIVGSCFDVKRGKSLGYLIMAGVDEASHWAGHGMVY